MDSILNKFPLGFPWKTQDPFLFCVHHLDHYPKGTDTLGPDPQLLTDRNLGNDFTLKNGWRMYHGQTIPGFPYHPHRGFETITIVNQGFCDHADSLGATGRFGEGDVQWMTAGRGVQHSEMFPLLKKDADNPLELFQLWLNLPKANKFVAPYFKMLWKEDIPFTETNNASIRVIAGSFDQEIAPDPNPDSWAATADHEVAIWDITIKANGSFLLPKAKFNPNRSLYFYEGDEIFVGQTQLPKGYGVTLDATVAVTITAGKIPAKLLVLQGKPIDEPVAQQGPFVMNTQEELQQAFKEYRLTQFGGWPWPYPDHVNEAEKGRFALYPDGTRVDKQS